MLCSSSAHRAARGALPWTWISEQWRAVSSLRGVGLFPILVILWHEFGGMYSASAPSLLSTMAEFLPSLPPSLFPLSAGTGHPHGFSVDVPEAEPTHKAGAPSCHAGDVGTWHSALGQGVGLVIEKESSRSPFQMDIGEDENLSLWSHYS